MQIVRDLAGYTWGRSDLVRRAMAKKKAAVMEKERQNFVYGNAQEGVKGCIDVYKRQAIRSCLCRCSLCEMNAAQQTAKNHNQFYYPTKKSI